MAGGPQPSGTALRQYVSADDMRTLVAWFLATYDAGFRPPIEVPADPADLHARLTRLHAARSGGQ